MVFGFTRAARIAGIAGAAIAATALAAAPPAPPEPIAGAWRTEGDKSIVEIRPCGAAMCGTIAQVLKADPGAMTTDRNNPVPALRGRPILGLAILTNFRPDGARWKGSIYDPRSGKTYKSFLSRKGQTLDVAGCVLFVCQSQIWQRAR